jgi:N-methylhydantoinase A/oxoprolinase/acetone carboxylase beta subunit
VAEIVEENMANAARVHAIERGKDIAAATMIAFGGGAPLHACRLAEKVGINHIIVPKGAGVGSAIGFLRAPIAYEITRSAIISLDNFDAPRVNRLLSQMTADARAVVKPAIGNAKPTVQIIADAAMSARAMKSRSAFRSAASRRRMAPASRPPSSAPMAPSMASPFRTSRRRSPPGR